MRSRQFTVQGAEIQQVFVGKILSIDPHPDADKLVVCKTDIGGAQPLQIVCGAKNMRPGDKVPTVVVGGELPGGFKIAARKMRGVESQGMMCSARELGLGEEHDGLLILDPLLRVGQDAKQALGLDDVILEVEITPNRGDWASMVGMAHELAAAYGKPLRVPELSVRESGTSVETLASVTVEAPELCPRYIARVVTNVKVGPSPSWLVKRLAAAGQRSINNIVDVTNYVMLETGQPLHAFDLDKLSGKRIVVRRARAGETIKTIDQETRKLDPEMLAIADADAPVAVAGVMGGFDSEVSERTVSVFVESAYFHPASVRKTSRALNLISESSQRFQRGVDPVTTLQAAHRACQLIVAVAGGEVAAGVLDFYPKPLPQNEISLRYARTNALLGTSVPPEEQRAILLSLGFEEVSRNAGGLKVRVPTWRHDCSLEADLIEEIARLCGYDRIPRALPRVRHTEDVLAPHYAPVRALRHYLVGIGLTETIPWTFSSPSDAAKAGLDGSAAEMVPVANPLTENHSTMRGSLIPSLLNTSASNIRKSQRNVAIFEIGPVYHPAKNGELPEQELRVGIALSGLADEQHWSRTPRQVDFYDIKGYAEEVLAYFGARKIEFIESTYATFVNHQQAEILIDKRPLGRLGCVDDAVLRRYDVEQPIYLFELELGPLLALTKEAPQFTEIPAFPPSLRDLALVVDRAVPAGALRDAAQRAGGKLLHRVDLFDIYTGEQVPAGKKSVALNLVFQSDERTLTDQDTQKAVDKILRALEQQHGAQLR